MRKVLLALLVTTAAIFGWAAVGLGAATVESDPTNFAAAGSDDLYNSTVSVDNDTRSVYVTLDNEAYNVSEPTNVTVYEVVNGSEVQVDQAQVSAESGSVETYEYTSIDAANGSEYRVTVIGNSSAIDSAALDVGTITKVSGGGGWLGGSGSSIGGIGLVALASVAFLVLREE